MLPRGGCRQQTRARFTHSSSSNDGGCLTIGAVEFHVEAFLARLAGVDRAADLRDHLPGGLRRRLRSSGRNSVDGVSDRIPEARDGTGRSLPEVGLHLGKGQLDRVEAGTLGRHEEHLGPQCLDGRPDGAGLWAGRLSTKTTSPGFLEPSGAPMKERTPTRSLSASSESSISGTGAPKTYPDVLPLDDLLRFLSFSAGGRRPSTQRPPFACRPSGQRHCVPA